MTLRYCQSISILIIDDTGIVDLTIVSITVIPVSIAILATTVVK